VVVVVDPPGSVVVVVEPSGSVVVVDEVVPSPAVVVVEGVVVVDGAAPGAQPPLPAVQPASTTSNVDATR
jgi:hypothetical protein